MRRRRRVIVRACLRQRIGSDRSENARASSKCLGVLVDTPGC